VIKHFKVHCFRKGYRSIPIRFHWSALALGFLLVLTAILGGWKILFLGCAYFGLLMFHEMGHLFIAEYFKREVLGIDIYFAFGICSYECRDDPYEESAIAWGGILAQLVLLLPV